MSGSKATHKLDQIEAGYADCSMIDTTPIIKGGQGRPDWPSRNQTRAGFGVLLFLVVYGTAMVLLGWALHALEAAQ